jgi:hypothetical protein
MGSDSGSDERAGTVSVYIPQPFTVLPMKLHAFADRMSDADVDLGRHHRTFLLAENDGPVVMAYQHTNRRGDIYYIQAKERGDKVAYSATRKVTGKLVDRLPKGYEIYEKPENAQLFVRKIKPTTILPIERQMVEKSLRKLARLEYFIVDVEADSIVVYLTDAEPGASVNLLRAMAPMTADQAESMRDFIIRRAMYSKMMRFVLTDENNRSFAVERWCFLGGIDDWFFLAGEKALGELIAKFVPHLGKESFFELI